MEILKAAAHAIEMGGHDEYHQGTGRGNASVTFESYSSKGKENSVLKPNQARILHLHSKRILVLQTR
ncbi:MAG: hypothetical protein V8Q79_05825 [Christensenellales bacterium]